MAPENSEIKISCTSCGATYRIPDRILGKMVTCKKCQQKFKAESVSSVKRYPLLGRIALENCLVKETDLIKAVAMQKIVLEKTGKELPLEDILLKQGMISEGNKLILVISVMRQLDIDFCRIAVSKYNVSQAQADQALDEQANRYKNNRERVLVGDILVASGVLKREDCNTILQTQGRIKAVSSEPSAPKASGSVNRSPEEKSKPNVPVNGTTASEKRTQSTDSIKNDTITGESGVPNQVVSEKVGNLKDQKFFHVQNLDKEFGKMIIDENLATKGEVKDALDEQMEKFQESGARVLIGNILVNEGILTADQRDAVLIKQKRLILDMEKFGQIAIEKGYLTKADVDKALQQQKEQKDKGEKIDRIGEILICMSLLTAEQRDEIVKIQTDSLMLSEDVDEVDEKVFETRFRDVNFQISISKDGLRAYLLRKSSIPSDSIDVWDLKDLLLDHKIAYGVVDDTMLELFLEYDGYVDKKLKIAQGKPARSGRPGKIKYYFDTEHLKVGALNEDGNIDFKNRGEIPHVSTGTLLAEKVPMIEGEEGVDVYGRPIHLETVRDISLKAGPGVELFEDGGKAVAKIDGQPDASFGGVISVLSELKIDGDVGYETGHINFDGNVNVSGIIKSGFQVKASNLTASEVQDAEIELTGDLIVTGGITGAKISLQGNIHAKYLKNATISAYGDVDIEKEIIDSKIDTSGMCAVKTGKILSSEIAAKKGILAKQVGTDMSSPCSLWIGVDFHMDNEIKKIHEKISVLQKNKEKLAAKEEGWGEKDAQLEADIAQFAHVQDRSMVEKRDLEKQLAEGAKTMDKESIEKIKATILVLDQKAKEADKNINQLFTAQDQLEKEKDSVKAKVMEIDQSISDLQDEKQEKLQWASQQKQDSTVSVTVGIYEGTKIFGQHASIILDKNYKRAQIKEVRIDPSRGKDGWMMKVE